MQAERRQKVVKKMQALNVDYLLLGPSANMFYLTGIKTFPDERLQLVILDNRDELTLVLPEMYRELIEGSAFKGKLVTWSDEDVPGQLVGDHISVDKQTTFAFDERIWFLHAYQLQTLIKEHKWVLANDVIKEVRMIKDRDEVAALKHTAGIADRVIEEMLSFIKEGRTEREIALEIEFRLKQYGGEGLSFTPIVASGPNGSLPHHLPGRRQLQKEDFITLDLGCVAEGYCSDITRTVALGEPDDLMKEVYKVVQTAQAKTFAAVRPGMLAEEIDAVARNVIAKAGYGDYFIHRTGHGLGLDVHEDPYIVKGSKIELKPGMVFSIEPGIYLPNKFGVRIEDIIIVTEKGADSLNNVPKNLMVI